MSVEEIADGGDAVGAEADGGGVGEGAEDAVGNVAGVASSVSRNEPVDGDADPRGARADAVKQEPAVDPVGGDSIEGDGEVGGRIVAPCLALIVEARALARNARALKSLTLSSREVVAEVVVGDADEAGEVGGAILDVVAVGLSGEGALGGMQHGQSKATEGADEGTA